jgi:flagellum-specific peptidoglycan hydrolase FlgJ
MKQLKKQITPMTEIASNSRSSLLNFISFNWIKKISKRLLIICIFGIMGFGGINLSETRSSAMSVGTNLEISNSMMNYAISVREKTKTKLIKEVEDYIKKISPASKINSEILVSLCEKYEVDLTFVIAQGILESHLGTRGQAMLTNSVWNVGNYDNGVTLNHYKDPNESIEPYLKLLRKKYLIRIDSRGDSIKRDLIFLIKDNGYVTCNGRRFATAVTYENKLRTMILKVGMESSILTYQGILKMKDTEISDFFTPVENNL